MAVAGHIVANLTANTTGWTSGLRAALSPLSLMTAAAGAFAAKGLAHFRTFGDSLDKMTLRTGISAEALSRLGYAANLSGTSLDSLQLGLSKQAQFMDRLNSGARESIDTLGRLGLSAGHLAGLGADQRFALFAERLSHVSDVGERSAIAMKIFGKGAIDLLPLLAAGESGLQAMYDEAERLGLVMSQKDASAAAAFGDSLDRLKMAGEGLMIKVVQPLIPIMTDLANGFAGIVGSNGEWISLIVKTGVVIGGVVLAFKAVTLATQAYTKAMAISQLIAGPKGWIQLGAGLLATAAATWAVNGAFHDSNDALNQATAEIDRSTAAFDANERSVRNTTDAVKSHQASMSNLATLHTQLMVPAAAQLRAELKKMSDDWHAVNKAGGDTLITWDQMKNLQLARIADASGFTDAFRTASDELAVLRGELTQTEQQFSRMSEMGVGDQQIDKLRQLMAERDKLLSEQQAKEQAAREQESRLSSVADRVASSNETPLSRFAAEVADVKAAIAEGFVNSSDGLAHLEKLRQQMLDDEKASQQKTEQRKQASNVGVDSRSAAANQQIVDLVNRRGKGSAENKAAAEQAKQTELAERSTTLLTNIRDDARRNTITAAPFRRAG